MKKLVDCFTFFNELDLLEIRLAYLYDTVDYFVIIEADMTFNGNEKPFILRDNLERFAAFKDKIILKSIKMKHFENEKTVQWKREGYQRDCITLGLEDIDTGNNSLILIGDLDEIPDRNFLEDLKRENTTTLSKKTKQESNIRVLLQGLVYSFKRLRYKLSGKDKYKPQLKHIYYTLFKNYEPLLNFNMYNCYYYINYIEKKNRWPGIQCVEAKWLKIFTPNEIRTLRNFPISSVDNSGWHFSYLGGKETIKYKLKNFSHQEYNIPEIVSDEYIDFCMSHGYSLFGYYQNPSIEPAFEKKEISYLPPDLQKVVLPFKKFIL